MQARSYKTRRVLSIVGAVVLLSMLLPLAAVGAPPAQDIEPVDCDTEYTTQADDWLSKVAEKYLGNVLAYQAIMVATNRQHAVDSSFSEIQDADDVEVGWKLCIPSPEDAEVLLAPPKMDEDEAAKVLIVAVPGDLEGWDPATATYFTANDMVQTLYDRLLEYEVYEGEDGRMYADSTKIKGMLAESYGVSEDGLTWTFNLRPGVKFSSGNELTSADVEYSYDRALGMGVGIFNTMLGFAGIKDPAQTVAVDPYTFQVTLEEPNNLILHMLALAPNACIVDSEVVKANATDDDPYAEKWMRNHVAGSGPYILDKYEPGNQVVYVANEDYWKGAPPLGKIIYKTVPSAQDRILLLMSGAIDMAYDIPGQDLVGTLKDAPGVSVESYPAPSTTAFFTHNTEAPYDDVRVRKALCYAVPYDALIDKVLYGLGTPAISPIANGVAFQKAVNECTYDPDKAKALLEEAGLADGFDMTLTYREGRPEEETVAVFLQAELAQYNINVELEKIQSGAWSERRSNKTISAGMDGYTPYAPDPTYVMNFWYVTDAVLNTWEYSNPRVDELTTMAVVEPDLAKVGAYMEEAQDIIGAEQPVVWLFNPAWNVVTRDNVDGYVFYPDRLTRHNVLTK